MHRDLEAVYIAETPVIAEVVVLWLGEHGIPAHLIHAGSEGPAQGIQVWVNDPTQAEEAQRLLEEFKAKQQAEETVGGGGPVEATCEECDKVTTFPAKERGSVQHCPHCGAFMDVTDGADEDADLDVGESEEGP